MKGNLELKISILRTGRKAYEIANDLGWYSTKISQIVTGMYTPDDDEKKRIAKVIGVPVESIFQKSNSSIRV